MIQMSLILKKPRNFNKRPEMTNKTTPPSCLIGMGLWLNHSKLIHAAHNIVLQHFGKPQLSYEEAPPRFTPIRPRKICIIVWRGERTEALSRCITTGKNHLDDLKNYHAENFYHCASKKFRWVLSAINATWSLKKKLRIWDGINFSPPPSWVRDRRNVISLRRIRSCLLLIK